MPVSLLTTVGSSETAGTCATSSSTLLSRSPKRDCRPRIGGGGFWMSGTVRRAGDGAPLEGLRIQETFSPVPNSTIQRRPESNSHPPNATFHRSDSCPATRPANDLLARLSGARHPKTGQRMSREQLIDNVLTFLLAGHHTTAMALTWTLYLIACAPEWEARMLEENLQPMTDLIVDKYLEFLPKLVYPI